MSKYAKRFDVPAEEVEQKRFERKRARANKPIKPIKKRLKRQQKQHEVLCKFRIPKQRKDYVELEQPVNGVYCRSISHCYGETISLRVKTPHLDYITWFWEKLTSGQLDASLALKLFPNPKEQSESVAALLTAESHISQLANATVVVVADGTTPRTGYLFAQKARNVFSIDPLMRLEWTMKGQLPNNLFAFQSTIESFIQTNTTCLPAEIINVLVVVAVHSHAGFENYLNDLLRIVPNVKVYIIAIPCCVSQDIPEAQLLKQGLKQLADFYDYGIGSPCRRVLLWSN